MDDNAKKNLIVNILKEAESYSSIDSIVALVEEEKDLTQIPVQPLYVTLKSLPVEKTSACLPRLSPEQRQTFLDLDLWSRDNLDVDNFAFWVMAYSRSSELILKEEFVKSNDFFLYLKGVFNIWTFDVEDPMYPDHDYYFLTDDSLLLFEYSEEYAFADEIRELIRLIYGELGVEKAYAELFKLTVDSFLIYQEEEIKAKIGRLRDYGFVDYFSALEIDNCFPSFGHIDLFVRKKEKTTGTLDGNSQNQTLHGSSIVAYKDKVDVFSEELAKVTSDKRFHYLHFNFIRLVNATMELQNAMKQGTVAMTRVGNNTRELMILGFNYIKNYMANNSDFSIEEDESLFDYFEFSDVYKIGNTLVKLNLKKINKELGASGFNTDNEAFLGKFWNDFLDSSFESPATFAIASEENKKKIINDVETYSSWLVQVDTLCELLPFSKSFYDAYVAMKEEGKLMDDYYLNYSVDDIDFEAILISSIANYAIGSYNDEETNKMGLTVNEFKLFAKELVDSKGKWIAGEKFVNTIGKFLNQFGLSDVKGISTYLISLLKEQIEGYEYENLSDKEFKHVGGPIILNRVEN